MFEPPETGVSGYWQILNAVASRKEERGIEAYL